MRIFALLIFFLAIVPFVQSQEEPVAAPAPQTPAQKQFNQAQLEQLVAPIALYPDSLLAQVLAASTYPVDVVAAARWIKKNPNLSQDEIKAELQNKKWDPSVQGIVFFPELLAKMNDNLDWTKDLGDAFMAQQKDVLDTVQVMRAKAKEAGTLKSDTNQKVEATDEGQIQIESADPELVYVDNYVPSESYGSWNNGGSWYYPQIAVAPAWPVAAYGAAWALAYKCAWNNGNISHYNNNYFANANRYYPKNIANKPWTHGQVAHRNVASTNTQQIAKQLGTNSQAAQNLRSNTPNAGTRSNAAAARNVQNTNRSVSGQQSKNNAFSGAKSSAAERSYSDRGYSSRSKSSSAKNRSSVSRSSGSRGGAHGGGSRGGGSRGSGGGRGGGGGRR